MNIIKNLWLLITLFTLPLWGSVGKVSVVVGDVTIGRGTMTLKAKTGITVEEKDSFTSTSGKAQIIFNDQTTITIGANSHLEISEFINDTSTKSAKFSVGKGVFKAITGQIAKTAPDKFKVQTKTATIGVRGTRLLGNIAPDGDKIACTKGTITVTSLKTGVTVTVPKGFIAAVSNTGVTPAKKFTPAEIKEMEKAVEVKEEKKEVVIKEEKKEEAKKEETKEEKTEETKKEATKEEKKEEKKEEVKETSKVVVDEKKEESSVIAPVEEPRQTTTTETQTSNEIKTTTGETTEVKTIEKKVAIQEIEEPVKVVSIPISQNVIPTAAILETVQSSVSDSVETQNEQKIIQNSIPVYHYTINEILTTLAPSMYYGSTTSLVEATSLSTLNRPINTMTLTKGNSSFTVNSYAGLLYSGLNYVSSDSITEYYIRDLVHLPYDLSSLGLLDTAGYQFAIIDKNKEFLSTVITNEQGAVWGAIVGEKTAVLPTSGAYIYTGGLSTWIDKGVTSYTDIQTHSPDTLYVDFSSQSMLLASWDGLVIGNTQSGSMASWWLDSRNDQPIVKKGAMQGSFYGTNAIGVGVVANNENEVGLFSAYKYDTLTLDSVSPTQFHGSMIALKRGLLSVSPPTIPQVSNSLFDNGLGWGETALTLSRTSTGLTLHSTNEFSVSATYTDLQAVYINKNIFGLTFQTPSTIAGSYTVNDGFLATVGGEAFENDDVSVGYWGLVSSTGIMTEGATWYAGTKTPVTIVQDYISHNQKVTYMGNVLGFFQGNSCTSCVTPLDSLLSFVSLTFSFGESTLLSGYMQLKPLYTSESYMVKISGSATTSGYHAFVSGQDSEATKLVLGTLNGAFYGLTGTSTAGNFALDVMSTYDEYPYGTIIGTYSGSQTPEYFVWHNTQIPSATMVPYKATETVTGADDYITWGYWNETANGIISTTGQTWYAGNITPSHIIQNYINNNQEATYNGKIIGSINGENINTANSSINMNMKFGTSTVNGSMAFGIGSTNNWNLVVSGTNAIQATTSSFTANLSGTGTGTLKGNFFGSQANAVAGNFTAAQNDGVTAVGTFKAAKK